MSNVTNLSHRSVYFPLAPTAIGLR